MSGQPISSTETPTPRITPAALAAIKDQLAKNPAFVSQLTEEETIAVRKEMSPLGTIVTPHKRWANMSVVNYKERWMQKFYMTSIAGYLFRLAKEYSPEEEIDVLHAHYDAAVAKLQSTRKNVNTDGENDLELKQAICDIRAEETARCAEIESTYRDFLERFLRRHFTYNPDIHVRKMHNDKGTQEAAVREKMIRDRCATSSEAVDARLKNKPDMMYKYMRSNLLEAYQSAQQTAQFMEAALAITQDTRLTLEEQRGILNKKYNQVMHLLADMKKIVEPITHAETYEALCNDPPADLTCHFGRYVSNHYEALREITSVLTNEQVDIEFSVTLYDTFKAEADAHAHLMAHEKEFNLEPITITNQGVTLMGPFKENRAKANFFNQRTDLLLNMHKQNISDQALAEDIVLKQTENKKRKEIHRDGPDKEGLSELSKVMNSAKPLGATKILDKKTMDRLEKERRVTEDAAVPKKSIQVEVYKTTEDDQGMPIMRKEIIYTAEEPPKFLEPNSPWTDKYLPVNYNNEESADTTPPITKPTKTLSKKPPAGRKPKGKLADVLSEPDQSPR